MAKYDKNKKKGDKRLNQDQGTTYSGFQPDDFKAPPKERRRPPKAPKQKAKATADEQYINDAEREQAELARIVEATVMPTAEFVRLSELSINKAQKVITRIEIAEELIADDPVVLDPTNTARLKNFTGSDVVDKQTAECLLNMANYSDLEPAYDAYNDGDPLQNADRPLRDTFNDDRINEAFPDFGFKLIIIIIKMTYEFIVSKILGGLCSLFRKTIILAIAVPPLKAMGRLLMAFVGKPKFDVCDDEVSLEEVIARWNDGNRDWLNPDEVAKNPDEIDPLDRCAKGYVPTYQDRQIARNLVDVATRIEQQAQRDHILSEAELAKEQNSRFMMTNMSMLESMKHDAHTFVATSKGMTHKVAPLPGYFVTDKVTAGMLGFLTNLNGIMQKFDAGVTKILALEFMSEEAKQWTCCIVRFMYLIIPRIKALKFSAQENSREAQIAATIINNKRGDILARLNDGEILGHIIGSIADQEDPKLRPFILKYARDENFKDLLTFESYLREGFSATMSLDDKKVMDQAKDWIALIDAIITFLLGSVSVNFEVNFSFSTAILDILKQAIAEAGSAIMSVVYQQVKEKLGGVFEGMTTKLPDVALALDMCPPIKWFFQNLECSIEGFFGKIQELLAQVWSDADASLSAMDFSLAITANNKSFTLLRNLLKMMLEWDQALINFCDLKRTATRAEREAIIDRTIGRMTASIPIPPQPPGTPPVSEPGLDQETYRDLLSQAGSVFSPNINLTPDASDPYATAMADNPLVPNIRTLHMQMFGHFEPEDFEGEAGVKPSLGDAKDESPARVLQEAVMSCGDDFKALFRGRIKDIEEIHRAVADGEEPNIETP